MLRYALPKLGRLHAIEGLVRKSCSEQLNTLQSSTEQVLAQLPVNSVGALPL